MRGREGFQKQMWTEFYAGEEEEEGPKAIGSRTQF